MSTSKSGIFKYSEQGGLNVWRLAAALEYSKKLFIGGEIEYLSGEDEMIEYKFDEDRLLERRAHKVSTFVSRSLSLCRWKKDFKSRYFS